MSWFTAFSPFRCLKGLSLSSLAVLFLFPALLQSQPATNQQQDPIVTDIPSHARGVPSNHTESFTNLNNLLHLFSLYRIPSRERARRVFHILLGEDQDSPDPRLVPIVESGRPGYPNICDGRHALLLHLAVWHIEPAAISDGKTPRTFALAQSEWHGFVLKPRGGKLESTGDPAFDTWRCKLVESEREDGTPSFYRGTDIYFVGVNAFDSLFYGSRVSVDYKLDTIGIVPQNILNLAGGISAATGVTLTPATPATTQLTPPTTIDTGADNPLPLALVTLLINVYQGRVNEMPSSSPLVPTAPRPYSLNTTFFLQFLPSMLTLTQGQILQDPSAPIQTNAENKTPSDTTVHLKERLEVVAKGYDVTALGPLPPVLNFTQDLEQEEHVLSASISQSKQIPAVTAGDDVAHIDAILARDYEAIAVIESSESAAIVQATAGLAKFFKAECTTRDRKVSCKRYYRGSPNLPDDLISNFTSSVESIKKDIQTEIEHYKKVISPAYLQLLSLLQHDASTIISDRDAVRSTAGLPREPDTVWACTASDLQAATTRAPETPQAYATDLDCILSQKSVLSKAVTHFNEHLSALGMLCRNSQNVSQDACRKPADKPYPACEAYTKTDDPNREVGEVAACEEEVEGSLANLNMVVNEFATPANSSFSKDLRDAVAKAQSALSAPLDVLADVQISNALMAQARLDQQAAEGLLEEQITEFSTTYQNLIGSSSRPTQKANAETSKTPETVDPGKVPEFQHIASLFMELDGTNAVPATHPGSLEWSKGKMRDIENLALAATSARQQVDEIVTAVTSQEPQPPPSSACVTSVAGGCCCCCPANGSSSNNKAVEQNNPPASAIAAPSQQTPIGNDGTKQADSLLSAAGMADAAPNAETETAFLTSPNTGGVISGIPFRIGDFPLVMVLTASNSGLAEATPACALSGTIEQHREACDSDPTQCKAYENDFPCMQFVALTTSAGGAAGAGGAQMAGAQQQGGGGGAQSPGGGAQSPGGGGKGANGGGGGTGGGGGAVAQSPIQAVDCSRQSSATGACAFTRAFTVDEPELWDFSLGLPFIAVAEYTFSQSATATMTTSPPCPAGYTCNLKHHEDAYVFGDLYPFAKSWFTGRPLLSNSSYMPHINAGIALTSQSLYRPYLGIAERFSQYLEHHLGLPLPLSLYAGMVFMKQQVCDRKACLANVPPTASTATSITSTTASNPQVLPIWDRAWKPTIGIEVSISAIASKLTKGGGASKASGTSSNGGAPKGGGSGL